MKIGICALILVVLMCMTLSAAAASSTYTTAWEEPSESFFSEAQGFLDGISTTLWVIILIPCITCAIASAYLASIKGYNIVFYFIFSFFFSIIGLILAAGLPKKETLGR